MNMGTQKKKGKKEKKKKKRNRLNSLASKQSPYIFQMFSWGKVPFFFFLNAQQKCSLADHSVRKQG